MSNRTLLRINVGAADSSLFTLGKANSFFRYIPWKIQTDKIRQRDRTFINQNIAFGQTIMYEYLKDGVLLEDTSIDFNLSAVVPVGGGGTFARLVDYAGFAMIRQMRLIYAQNQIQLKKNIHYFINHLRDHDIQHREVFEAEVAGELTAPQRNTRAAAPQTLRTYLKPYWYGLAGHSARITALALKIRIELDLCNVEDIVQTDYPGHATLTIQSVKWNYDLINMTGTDRDSFTQDTLTPRGITYLMEDVATSGGYMIIPAGVTATSLQLQGYTQPFSNLYCLFQKRSQVSTPWGNDPFGVYPADMDLISYASLNDGETIIEDDTSANAVSVVIDFSERWQKKHVIGQWRKPILVFSLAEIADIKNQNTGSLNASNINNFLLNLTFTGALAEDYVLYPVFIQHNWVNHQAAELQRAFN